MAKKKIEDFGEEIFGARKHLAQLNRELRATDIGDWTDAEREQNVTKNTAFPKVDYKKEYADGKDREVLYFIKTLRDKLPTQPLYPLKSLYTPEQLPEAKRQAQEDYLTTVSYVYQKAMQLEKPEDFKKFFNEVSAAKLPKSDKILKDAKKVLDFDGRWGEYTYQRFQSKLEKNKFCFSDKEKLLSNYEIYKYDGKNVKRDEQLSKAYHKDYMNVSFGYGKRIFLANNETEANPDNWKQDTYFASLGIESGKTYSVSEFDAEQPAPEHSESVAIDCDIADITRTDDGFYEFELSIETVVEALNRAADVSEDLQNFFVENGVPEKSVIEADEPYMVYGEMNPDIDDGISMRLQLINPDIDVEIPLYKEECHALSEKIAILDKAEPELPKEDNEKEFVQLEFDFDKE